MIPGAVGDTRSILQTLLCQSVDCNKRVQVAVCIPAPTWKIVTWCGRCGAENTYVGTPFGVEAAVTKMPVVRSVRAINNK